MFVVSNWKYVRIEKITIDVAWILCVGLCWEWISLPIEVWVQKMNIDVLWSWWNVWDVSKWIQPQLIKLEFLLSTKTWSLKLNYYQAINTRNLVSRLKCAKCAKTREKLEKCEKLQKVAKSCKSSCFPVVLTGRTFRKSGFELLKRGLHKKLRKVEKHEKLWNLGNLFFRPRKGGTREMCEFEYQAIDTRILVSRLKCAKTRKRQKLAWISCLWTRF